MHQTTLRLPPHRRGLADITSAVSRVVSQSGVESGLCNVFILHTSASLLIQENASPDVLADMDVFFTRLVKDGDPRYLHSDEGPDDMSAHIRSALTQTSLNIPVLNSSLHLGTWQGLYLFEHRTHEHERRVVVTVMG